MGRLRRLKMQTRIMLALFVTLCFVISIMMAVMYRNNEKIIEQQALYSFEENVQKSCRILDTKLSVIKEATEKLNLETRLYSLFANLDHNDSLMLLRTSNEIKEILRDYIPWYSDIYSIHLVTSYYRFGNDTDNYYPNFMDSEIAVKAYEANGKSVWFPTYSYTEMYHITNLNDNQIPYGRLFSVARLMNISDVSSGKVKRLSNVTENPVLVINMNPDYMKKVLESHGTNDSLKDTIYYVMDQEGKMVYCTDETYPEGEVYDSEWLDENSFEESYDGFYIKENGKKYILSYCKSEITDWLVVMKIPVSSLLGTLRLRYIQYCMAAFAIMLILAALLAWIESSAVNRSFYKVIGTIDFIGQGNFEGNIEYDKNDEFAFFYEKLLKMSQDIRNLIHENYEVKLMQKDTEIKALNAQLNPHFIYNTLNIINWTCLEGDMDGTSKMLVTLSRMLRYTSYHVDLYEELGNDIDWLRQYIYIMQLRFADKFKVIIDIPEHLMKMKVPKLFLQPFVENAIVHGFREFVEDGLLEIYAEEENDAVIFYIEDNGCGMSKEQTDKIVHGDPNSIGIANVDQRIKILYGNDFGVECLSQPGEGTCIKVVIPRC